MARQAEFALGQSTTPVSSLVQDSGKQNALARQAALTPHSVLSAYMNFPSPGNGNSAQDAKRQTPGGELPSENGYASQTYSQRFPTTFGTKLDVA
jgi:hypothetical protein